MKSKFIFGSVLVAAAWLAACSSPPPQSATAGAPHSTAADDGQRLVALIDYVSADYGGAVQKGVVVSDFEYQEQLGFLETATGLVQRVARDPGDTQALAERIRELQAAVQDKAEASVVAKLGRAAREDLVSRLGLVTMPRSRPSLANGRALFQQACATCHGSDGLGQTEVAALLDPRPTSFKDAERRPTLSPYRIYNALTLGVAGTAMPAFDSLSDADRWDLAFFTLRLGHEGEAARGPVSITLGDLSARSDADVLASLEAAGHPAPSEGLVFARREAAYAEAPLGLGIDQTRSLVRKAASLGTAGRGEEADRVALDAYLQGFEPLEAQISARDPNRTQAVEIAFRDFRAALVSGNRARIESEAEVLDELIARAQNQTGATLPFVAAFIIYFREGVEAALLVGALLGGVLKLERPDAARAIHIGWIAAVIAGILSWAAFSRLVAVAPADRELMEAIIGFCAALVLFSVSFWMISKAESRKWMAFLKDQVNRGLNSGRVWSFAGVAFLAVYRECAETILFTQALLIEATTQKASVAAGAFTGLVAVVAIALLIQDAFRRLPMPLFFGVSGAVLSLLAIVFAGSSISAFVAAGLLKPNPIDFPSVPMLGIHPDVTSLAVQFGLLLLLTGAGIKTFLDSRVPDRA